MTAASALQARRLGMVLWPAVTAVHGEAIEGSFADLARELGTPCARPANADEPGASLAGWSPIVARASRRGKEHVLGVTALVLDLDKGDVPLERLREVFAGRRAVLHATRRWRANARRWRVVLDISRDMTPAEYGRVWCAMRDALAAQGVALDEGAKDSSRFWFVPCDLADGAPFICELLEGAPLDVDALLVEATLPLAPPRAKPIEPSSRPMGPGGYGETALAGELQRVATATEGGRHGALNVAAFKAAQLAAGGEIDEHVARAQLVQVGEAVLGPGRASEVRRTVNDAFAAGSKAPRARAERPRPTLRAVAPSEAGGPPGDERPIIQSTSELHDVVDAAAAGLRRDGAVYTRGGQLVRIVQREDEPRGRVRREPGTPVIRPLVRASARDALSAVARWMKYDARTRGLVPCSPPGEVADSLLARGHWPGLRPLEGIATAPILRHDGTVADVPGYDVATGYLLTFEPGERVSPAPTREQALAARDRVLAMVADFPFQTEADRSAWLALVLTLTCRAAILGPVPMWTITANIRGSGKSKLADVAATIATGRGAARATHPADEAEFGKVLTSIAVEADPLVLFDNVDRPIGGGKLDAWLTGERWSDRLLGTNVKTDLPIVSVLAATGNNLEPTGDTLRRVLPVRIESEHEHPESRDDFQIKGELLAHVRAHRDSLARDVVTMAAAWFAAGRPRGAGVASWGSFEAWGAIVPHVCRFLDLPDPMATREGLEEDDPKTRALRTLFARWTAVEVLAGTYGLTARELVERVFTDCRARPGFEDVAAALETLAPGRGRDRVDVNRLGYVFRASKRRKIGGKRIDRAAATHEGGLRWTVS